MSLTQLPARNETSPLASMRGHHVALRVPDFETELSWFLEKLDFRLVHRWPYEDQQVAYLAPPDDDGLFVELLGGGRVPPLPRPPYKDLADSLRQGGQHHFCLNVADLDATISELRRRGVTIVTEPFVLDVIHRKLAFIADPNGNLIELAQVL